MSIDAPDPRVTRGTSARGSPWEQQLGAGKMLLQEFGVAVPPKSPAVTFHRASASRPTRSQPCAGGKTRCCSEKDRNQDLNSPLDSVRGWERSRQSAATARVVSQPALV